MPRIQQEWERYRDMTLPENVSAERVIDLQTAFYSGAYALFTLVMSNLSPGPEVAPEDEELMESLMNELEEFVQKTVARAAISLAKKEGSRG